MMLVGIVKLQEVLYIYCNINDRTFLQIRKY